MMDIRQLILLSGPRVLIGRYYRSYQCIFDLHNRDRCMDRTGMNPCQNIKIPVIFARAIHAQIDGQTGLIPSVQSDDQECAQCADSASQRNYQGHFNTPASMVGFLKKGLLCESFNSIGKLTALFSLPSGAALPCNALLHYTRNLAPMIAAFPHGDLL